MKMLILANIVGSSIMGSQLEEEIVAIVEDNVFLTEDVMKQLGLVPNCKYAVYEIPNPAPGLVYFRNNSWMGLRSSSLGSCYRGTVTRPEDHASPDTVLERWIARLPRW